MLTSFGVALEAEHDFGSAVPTGSHVFCHVACVLFWVLGEASGETEVADLELAIGVDEKIAGFEISMKDIGGVNVFETAENLVDEGLEVRIGQWLARADDSRKIALHEF